MNRLPFFKRKQKSNSFEQLLTATAVKSAAINIDFTIRSIQEIELTDASFKDYDDSCLHSITSIQFVFQYTVKASRTYTLRCTAVNSTRFGWQISQVTQI